MPYKSISIKGDECAHGSGNINNSANLTTKTFAYGAQISLANGVSDDCNANNNNSTTSVPETTQTKCFIEGRLVVRVGDPRSCGGYVAGPDRHIKVGG